MFNGLHAAAPVCLEPPGQPLTSLPCPPCHIQMQVEAFRVKKQTSLGEFKQILAEKWNVPVERQRLWIWATRQNHSHRPSGILQDDADNMRVCDIRVSACLPTKPSHSGTLAVVSCCIDAR